MDKIGIGKRGLPVPCPWIMDSKELGVNQWSPRSHASHEMPYKIIYHVQETTCDMKEACDTPKTSVFWKSHKSRMALWYHQEALAYQSTIEREM